MTAPISIDLETLKSRLGKLRALWQKEKSNEALCRCDVVVVGLGEPSDFTVYQKSTAYFTWLLGYEFPETIMAITKDKIAFLTSQRKASILKQVADGLGGEPVKLFGRDKEKGKGKEAMREFWNWITSNATGDKEEILKVGVFAKDKREGPMYDEWKQFYENDAEGMKEEVEISTSFSTLFAVKDATELEALELAGQTSSLLMKEFVSTKLLTMIDEAKKVTHAQVSEMIESHISDQLGRYRNKLPAGLSIDLIDICYPPIIQSGGHYSLKPSAMSNEERLANSGVFLVSLGIRYKSYCSNIGRTFLVDVSRKQEEELEFLAELQRHCLSKMTPGVGLSTLYESALGYVKTKRPELADNLVANLGFGMGLEFRESDYLINAKSTRSLEPGMVFNLVLGLQGLSTADGKPYALLLADTVAIQTGDRAAKLTSGLDALKNVSFSFKSQEQQRGKGQNGAATNIRSRLRNHQPDLNAEKKRKEHQKELMVQITKEALAKHSQDGSTDGTVAGKEKTQIARPESYRKEANFPRDACTEWKIVVDRRAETIILPIQGYTVPFHISTVKNVTKNDEGDFVCLRINFATPGRTFGKAEGPSSGFEDPLAEFIRGVLFRSTDAPRVQETFKAIQDLRKQYIEKENTKKEMSDLVEQANLVEVPSGKRPIRLVDVYARPTVESRRSPGDVEIHANGIRYKSQLKSDQRIGTNTLIIS